MRTHRFACEAQPGVSAAWRTVLSSPGGRTTLIMVDVGSPNGISGSHLRWSLLIALPSDQRAVAELLVLVGRVGISGRADGSAWRPARDEPRGAPPCAVDSQKRKSLAGRLRFAR